jgi:hypothetical protein
MALHDSASGGTSTRNQRAPAMVRDDENLHARAPHRLEDR